MVHSPSGRVAAALLLAVLGGLGLLAAVPAIAAGAAEAAEAAAPLAREIARGHDLLERRLTAEAVRAFRDADEMAGGASAEALIGLARAYHQLGASSAAEKAARRAAAAAGDDPALRFRAQETLRLVLAGAERGGDGDGSSADPMITLDGRSLSLNDFRGRAVLLDFWGTWCPPCREAMPALGRLAGELDGEPFELVGVGHEARGVLEVYVEKHDMEWIQVWDRGGEVTRERFGVTTYPTYVLLDHEGREVYRITGWDERIRRRLERKVHTAVREAREAAERDGG